MNISMRGGLHLLGNLLQWLCRGRAYKGAELSSVGSREDRQWNEKHTELELQFQGMNQGQCKLAADCGDAA